jgi:hypothetical protein
MNKYALFILALIVMAVGCGQSTDTPNKDGGNKTDNSTTEERPDKKDGMVLYKTAEGPSFYVPEGWKSVVFKFPPTIKIEDKKNPNSMPIDITNLVEAGAEIVFYPPDMDFADLEKKLVQRDFRYIEDLKIKGSIIVYMQGATNKYFPDACKNYPQVTFYDDGESDYKSFTIPYAKDQSTEACSATLKPPALKFNGMAYMYVAYGKRLASTSQPLTQFSGLAVVGNSLSGQDKDLFDKVTKSFKFLEGETNVSAF